MAVEIHFEKIYHLHLQIHPFVMMFEIMHFPFEKCDKYAWGYLVLTLKRIIDMAYMKYWKAGRN